MDRFYIALVAFAGGVLAAILGWLDASEAFDLRKFGGSVIRTLIAAILFAVSYQLTNTPVTVRDLLYAFLGGAGVDVIGNRIAGALGSGSFPLLSKKKDQ